MTDRSYRLPLAMLLISAAALSGAYASQHLGGLQPCSLCLYQRWPWWIVGGLAILALLFDGKRLIFRALIAFSALTVLVGTGIAVYHVGVEARWCVAMTSPGHCSVSPWPDIML